MIADFSVKRGATLSIGIEVFAETTVGSITGTETVRAVLKASYSGVAPGDAAADAAVFATEWRAPLAVGLANGWLCTLSAVQMEALKTGLHVMDFRLVMAGGVVVSKTVKIQIEERVTEAA